MSRLAIRIKDKSVLLLIRSFLTAGVMLGGLVEASEEGTPQGPPSPLLSNIVLDELDKELEMRGLCFVRYADDCVIFVGSERAGRRVMESVSRAMIIVSASSIIERSIASDNRLNLNNFL